MKEESFFSYCNEKEVGRKKESKASKIKKKKALLNSDIILNHGKSELILLTITGDNQSQKVRICPGFEGWILAVMTPLQHALLLHVVTLKDRKPLSPRAAAMFALCVYF